jgi:hypothetical protein
MYEYNGIKIGEIVYSVCADWEEFNPMVVVGFVKDPKEQWYEIACRGNNGLIYTEIDLTWLSHEEWKKQTYVNDLSRD